MIRMSLLSVALLVALVSRGWAQQDTIPAGERVDVDFLLELRRRYTMYLLSNTNGIHWQWALEHAFNYQGHRVEDFFDRIFLSYEMKLVKPDEEIFRRVIAETGLTPSETLFIDDAESNCRAAQALGIRTYMPQLCEDWRPIFKAENTCG